MIFIETTKFRVVEYISANYDNVLRCHVKGVYFCIILAEIFQISF